MSTTDKLRQYFLKYKDVKGNNFVVWLVVVQLNLLFSFPVMLCKHFKLFKTVFSKHIDKSYRIYTPAYIVYSFNISSERPIASL